MRVVLFGAGNRGTLSLIKLLELKQNVVGVIYFQEDNHENIWYNKIENVAHKHNIPTIFYKELNKNTLDILNPDVAFAISWRYKIKREIYTHPHKGTIIIHDSLLPKYRGFAPMNWTIINGEKETGVTMFYIADEIDSGDIIAQKSIPIGINETAKDIDTKITPLYLQMLEENIPLIEGGNIKAKPQNHAEATYTCKRIPEDGLIDWTKSSWEIYNLIRGLSYPYPNAYTHINGEYTLIEKASLPYNSKNYVGRICGRVVDIIKGKGVEVLTGDSSIIIEYINQDGHSYRADEVIKSIKTTLGR